MARDCLFNRVPIGEGEIPDREILALLAKHDHIPSVGPEIFSSALDALPGEQIMARILPGFEEVVCRLTLRTALLPSRSSAVSDDGFLSLSGGSIQCSPNPTGPTLTALKAFRYSRSQFLSLLVRSVEPGTLSIPNAPDDTGGPPIQMGATEHSSLRPRRSACH